MNSKNFHLPAGQGGAALAVRVVPRSSRNEVAEVLDDGTIKVRLTAPPVEGKANQALITFLSEILDVPRSKIEIVAGQTGRLKLVSILGLDALAAQERILKKIGK